MSSFLAGYISSRKNHLISNISTNPSSLQSGPKSTEKEVTDQVEKLAGLYDQSQQSEEEKAQCILACVHAIDKELSNFDFSCSAACRKKFDEHFHSFNRQIVGAALKAADIDEVKLTFKGFYLEWFQKKWAKSAGEAFYPILSYSTVSEKAEAAKLWTSRFFEGVAFFNQYQDFLKQMPCKSGWKGNTVMTKEKFIQELENLVFEALKECVAQAGQSQSKLANLPQCSLQADQRVRAISNRGVADLKIDEVKTLLANCVRQGLEILQEMHPIMNNEEAGKAFLTCFQNENSTEQ